MTHADRSTRTIDAALILGLSALFFGARSSLTEFIFGGDVIGHYLPAAAFLRRAVSEGQFPLWNPFQGSGLPTFALGGFLYPPHAAFIALPFAAAQVCLYVIHLWLGGFGAYMLAVDRGISRTGSLVAGCAFMFSTPFIARIWAGHLSYVEAFGWVPWVVLAATRAMRTGRLRDACVAGLITSILLYISTYQILLYLFLFLAVAWCWRVAAMLTDRNTWAGAELRGLLASLPVMTVVAFGSAAVTVIPAVELLSLATRGGPPDFKASAQSSLSPAALLTSVMPDLFGRLGHGTAGYIAGASAWESVVYVGVLTLALAIIATVSIRRMDVAVVALFTAAALALTMGRYTPLYEMMFRFVPGVQLFRIPSRAHGFVALGLAVLAGYGTEYVLRRPRPRWIPLGLAGLGLVLLSLCLAIAWPGPAREWVVTNLAAISSAPQWGPSPGVAEIKRRLMAQLPQLTLGFARGAGVLMAAAVCIAMLAYARTKPLVGPLLILIVLADLWGHGATLIVPVSENTVYPQTEYLRLVTADNGLHRVYAGPVLPGNGGMLYGYFDVESSRNAILDRYWRFIAPPDQRVPRNKYAQQTFLPVVNGRVLYMLNVRYAAVSAPLADPRWKLVTHGEFDRAMVPEFFDVRKVPAWIYEHRDPLPRAYFVDRCRNVDDDTALRLALDPAFDPRVEVLLPPGTGTCGPSRAIGTVSVTSYRLNSIDLAVDANGPGYVVLSEIYYPGWRAHVDGTPTAVHRANYTFRAIEVSPGRHRVRLVFFPLSVWVGLGITTITVIGAAAIILERRVRPAPVRASDADTRFVTASTATRALAWAGRALFLAGIFLMVTGDWPRSTLLSNQWTVPLPWLGWPWLYLALLAASIVLLLLGGILLRPRPLTADFLNLPMALLACAFLVSVAFSQVPSLSWWAFGCFVVVAGFALAVARIVEDETCLMAIPIVLAAAALLLATRVIVWRLDEGLWLPAYHVRNNAWLGKIQIAWVLSLLTPFFLARYLGEHTLVARFLYGLAWLLSGAAIGVLFARTGTLAFALTTLTMCALNPRHWRRSLPIFAGLVGLGVGWITMILKARYLGDLLLHPDWYATLAIRHDILHQSIRMIMDHPLAGIGFGTYDDVAHTQYGPIALPWFFRRGWHAHNTFLHLLAETGIVGILAWCYLWFTIVRFLVRRWRDDVRDRLHGSAALCVLLAFFVLSMTESVTAARLHASLRMNLTLTFLVIYGIRVSGGTARRPAGAPSEPLLGREPTFGTSG